MGSWSPLCTYQAGLLLGEEVLLTFIWEFHSWTAAVLLPSQARGIPRKSFTKPLLKVTVIPSNLHGNTSLEQHLFLHSVSRWGLTKQTWGHKGLERQDRNHSGGVFFAALLVLVYPWSDLSKNMLDRLIKIDRKWDIDRSFSLLAVIWPPTSCSIIRHSWAHFPIFRSIRHTPHYCKESQRLIY